MFINMYSHCNVFTELSNMYLQLKKTIFIFNTHFILQRDGMVWEELVLGLGNSWIGE